MMKKGRTMLALLCAIVLLAASAGSAAPNIRSIRTIIGRIEQGCIAIIGEISSAPADCTGYELAYRPDLSGRIPDDIISALPAAEAGEDGLIRCPLDEETTRRLLENAYAASIGPDGSILWFITDSAVPAMLVQHGKTLVAAAQSSSRGAPDTDGSLKDMLDYKLRIATEPAESETCWSPDSRYLFFNDTERWRSERQMLNDPYLLDTQTGEIFLIESSGNPKNPLQDTFRCVLNGCFSADGKSFYWYCRSYTAGARPEHFLMRYDLESGAQETVCALKSNMADFCELRENRWLLLETSGSETSLVRIAVTPDGIERTEEPLPSFCGSACFLPAVRENVLLAATPMPSGGTYLLPLTWDTPVTASWYKIGSIEDAGLRAISPEEIEAELLEAKATRNEVSGSKNIGTACIRHAAAIIGVTDLLLTVYIREPVPDYWGGGLDDFSGQVILNTEDLKLFPIRTSALPDGLRDSVIDGNFFLGRYYGYDFYGLYPVYSLPDLPFILGEIYTSPYGTFMCRSESDPLVLSSVTLVNRELSADIAVGEDSCTIRFHIADFPAPETVRQEFAVPEVLTADRWTEITSAMGGKDRKKFSNLYSKSTPEQLAERPDGDEITASYPAAAAETAYILKEGLKAANLEMAEKALKASGYTAEDFERDMEQVAAARDTNAVVSKSGKDKTSVVRYTFSIPDSVPFPGTARIHELAGLCERIGRAVLANRVSAEPLPAGSVIQDRYQMGSIDFYVTVDRIEATETTLEFSLTVTDH